MYTKGVKHIRERMRRAKKVEGSLSSVEQSRDSATEGVAHGAIALVKSALPLLD